MNVQRSILKQKKYFFIEKLIITFIMFIFILLIGFNTIRTCAIEQFLKFNDIYGLNDFRNDIFSQGTIEITIEKDKEYPMLEIIINGDLSDYRFEKNNRVLITVCDGDVIQINSSMYNDNIKIKIKNMSPNISNVLNNDYIILKENIVTLAVIRI